MSQHPAFRSDTREGVPHLTRSQLKLGAREQVATGRFSASAASGVRNRYAPGQPWRPPRSTPTEDGDYSSHTSPGSNVRKRSVEMPASFKASASAMNGASIGSSVSWNVP
jgi:hypothetical protein